MWKKFYKKATALALVCAMLQESLQHNLSFHFLLQHLLYMCFRQQLQRQLLHFAHTHLLPHLGWFQIKDFSKPIFPHSHLYELISSIPIPYFSLLPILIFLMKTACITILNSVLYVFALIMEPISVLPPIFQKKNFLWKKSINFTGCAGARKQASVNSNTPSV